MTTSTETEASVLVAQREGKPMYEQYKIIANRGHHEVYLNGEFFCSADNYGEAVREIEEEEAKLNARKENTYHS